MTPALRTLIALLTEQIVEEALAAPAGQVAPVDEPEHNEEEEAFHGI